VVLDGISLPAGAVSFNAYRGTTPGQLFRIASAQSPQSFFTDTGFPVQAILPPDPQFDHVNIYWRWEMTPETPAAAFSLTMIGNSILELHANRYIGYTVRITQGTGAGEERSIASNTSSTLTLSTPGASNRTRPASLWFVKTPGGRAPREKPVRSLWSYPSGSERESRYRRAQRMLRTRKPTTAYRR